MSSARDAAFADRLRVAVRGTVAEQEPLVRYSTYRIGGPATLLQPADPEDLAVALRLAAETGVPVFPLGLGSNVLLPDEGMEALILRLGKGLDAVRQDEARWTLGAGLPAPLIARRTAETGWAGLQMMVGVPGTVGGGVYMNAGCHGGEWADVVRRVRVVDRLGAVRDLSPAEIPFAYRRSGLGELIVVEAEVQLVAGDPEELAAELKRLFEWRQRGTPFNRPCCGSVFQNPGWRDGPPAPDRRTAGQLIEACGFKGTREGAIEVSPRHANYFVNLGGGRATDVRRLMERVAGRVEAEFGVRLEPEVKLIGRWGEALRLGD